MRERIRIFFQLILFWLSFMVVARIVFLCYNHELTAALTWRERGLAMLHGLRMDASMTGYFVALAGLLLVTSVLIRGAWISYVLKWLTLLLLIITSLIITIDLELYRHWGFRLNTTPFLYISKEAAGSVSLWVILKLTIIFCILSGTYGIFFIRRINPRILYLEDTSPKAAIPLTLLTALLFIPIRGSFTVAPMNTGFVYFHNTKVFANHSAINVVWNFAYSLRKSSTLDYPETFLDPRETDRHFKALYDLPDSTQRILRTTQPNVILIILESFTAGVIGPLGGPDSIAPNLNALAREGVLFDNFYSSGDRTDKGLISILSGYPAQPQTSIIKFPAKSQRLPQLNQFMRKMGYHTSFVYGGDIDFANFRSYLNTSGFDHITSLDDFDEDLYTSKWGVHDHYMFERTMEELDTAREKFFKVILTLSSHEPFDVPMKPFIEGDDEESLFLNSCHYTDRSLGDFIRYLKRKPWWNNTLVVITADHGHRLPGNKSLQDKERFHIPLLLIGGALSTQDTNHTIGSQTDIANTILAQIDRPSPDFTFSKNLFNPATKPFAAWYFNDGYGFLTTNGYVSYDNTSNQFMVIENAGDSLLTLSKAHQQKLYTHYNNIDK